MNGDLFSIHRVLHLLCYSFGDESGMQYLLIPQKIIPTKPLLWRWLISHYYYMVRFMEDDDFQFRGKVGFLYEQDGVEVYCAYVLDEMEGFCNDIINFGCRFMGSNIKAAAKMYMEDQICSKQWKWKPKTS